SNAIKFTDWGGVSFSVRYRSQVAEFVIRDSGVGIESEDLERIFRPFERVRKPGMTAVPGTGLGLTITRLLTDIMGGDINLQSEPGVGSTFSVSLMLSRIDSPSLVPVPEQRSRGYRGARKTIMVVDDDPSHRGLISDILGPIGFVVVEAPSGNDCLVLTRQCEVDAYLLDVSMPGMSGWQLAACLRESGIAVPVIMISADAREGQREQTDPHRHHDDYVVKPVRLQSLLEKLGVLLQLDWFHENDSSDTDAIPLQVFLPQQLPPSADLQELRALAEIGYVNGLRKKINQLSQEGSTPLDVILYLQRLTSQFRFDRIIAMAETIT